MNFIMAALVKVKSNHAAIIVPHGMEGVSKCPAFDNERAFTKGNLIEVFDKVKLLDNIIIQYDYWADTIYKKINRIYVLHDFPHGGEYIIIEVTGEIYETVPHYD